MDKENQITSIKMKGSSAEKLRKVRDYYGFSSIDAVIDALLRNFDSFEIKVKKKRGEKDGKFV